MVAVVLSLVFPFIAQGLTAGVSPDVLESMRLLVETVMGGMGDR